MRREAKFERNTEGGHHVLHIEFAHERILEGDRFPPHAKHNARACDIVSDLDRMNVSVLGESGRDHLIALFKCIGNESLSPRAVDIDDAFRRIIRREKPPFRSKIRLERLVIVEVILREVGECSDRKGRIPHAIEIECMRACLHGHHFASCIAHLSEDMLQVARFRGGVIGRQRFACDIDPHRADHAGGLPQRRSNVLNQMGGRGLTVRSRDSYERKILSWHSIEVSRKMSHCLARVVNEDEGNIVIPLHFEHALDH